MKKLHLIIFAIMLAALTYCSLMKKVSAENPVLAVEGPGTVDFTISETFNVSIVIHDVPEPGFYGWEFYLSWTPGIINCTREVINYNLWGGNYLGPWVTNPIDNAAGKYHQSLSGRSPGTPETGTFWLVNLTFKVLVTTPTTVELTLSPPEGCSYCIADIEANEIPHDFQNLPVGIVPEFSMAVLPILIASSTVAVIMTKKLKK